MNTRKLLSIILGIMVLLASGCNLLNNTPWNNPTPTPHVLSDCFLSFKVAAWEDLNGDGVWDGSEPPLAGVEFHLQGKFAQRWGPDPSPERGEGWFSILIWSPGNFIEQEYTISAVPPESVEPTTPLVVTLSDTAHLEAQFGFRKLEGDARSK